MKKVKKTQLTVLLRTIWSTKVSFFSIVLFVALGIAIFLGIRWNNPTLLKAAEEYYSKSEFYDFNIMFPYGITDEDIEKVLDVDGVSKAEGIYMTSATLKWGNNKYIVTAQSVADTMNFSTAIEGELPQNAGEVGIEQKMATALGLKVGDRITFNAVRGDKSALNSSEFVVSAIVSDPSYVALEGIGTRGIANIGDGQPLYYVLMHESAFSSDAFDGLYSNLYLRCDVLRSESTFSKAYKEQLEKIAKPLSELGAERGLARYEEVYGKYRGELDDAIAKIESGEAEIIEAEKAVAVGLTELQYWQDEYDKGMSAYEDGKFKLEQAKQIFSEVRLSVNEVLSHLYYNSPQRVIDHIDEYLTKNGLDFEKDIIISDDPVRAKAQIANVRDLMSELSLHLQNIVEDIEKLHRDVEDYIKQFGGSTGSAEQQSALDAIFAALDKNGIIHGSIDQISQSVEDMLAVFGTLKTLVDAIGDPLDQIEEKLGEYIEGTEALKKAEIELAEGKAQIDAGQKTVEETLLSIEAGKAELADGKKKVADGEKSLSEMIKYDTWQIEKRTENSNFYLLSNAGSVGDKLSFSMAMLFVFVGVMICYTSLSRIVQEKRSQIGMQKALGFTRKEVMSQFIAYAVIAVLVGSVVGALLGYFVIESIMNNSIGALFIFEITANHFSFADLLVITLIEMLLICLAAWLACRKQLAKQAIELLKDGESAVHRTRFFEKHAWWKKLSLYTQTTVNNLLHDKTRVIATLVGLSGCIALVIMALTFRHNIHETPIRHFDEVMAYDYRITVDTSVDGAMENVQAVLDESGAKYAELRQEMVILTAPDGTRKKFDIIAIDDISKLEGFINLRSTKDNKPIELPRDGAFINSTYTKYHNADPGTQVSMIDTTTTEEIVCTVVGEVKYYMAVNQLIMGSSYYERVKGNAPDNNTIYLSAEGVDYDALCTKLSSTDGFFSITSDAQKWSQTFNKFQQTTLLMVIIAFGLSIVMAMMVLLNLNIVLINEKKNEIIIMLINGFSVKKAKQYVYRDNIVLTVIGIVLGVGLGNLLSLIVISSVSSETVMLITSPHAISCIIGAAIGVTFAILTNVIALRRVNKFKASDLR